MPRRKRFDIIGLGRSCMDHLAIVPRAPEAGEKLKVAAYRDEGGGQVATALVTAARLGAKCALVGRIGADRSGHDSLRLLRAEGIDCSRVEKVKGKPTPQALIVVDERSGERTILYERPSFQPLTSGKLCRTFMTSARLLIIDPQETKAGLRAAQWARAAGMRTMYDAERVKDHVAEMIPLTDYLITSEDFPRRFTGRRDVRRAGRELLRLGPELVVITLGARGSVAFTRKGELRTPGYKVAVVDTTGAGDAFHGAFLAGVACGFELKKNLEFSNAVAALSCTALGGRAGLPTRRQAMTFLKKIRG